jgi:hypothetical protein
VKTLLVLATMWRRQFGSDAFRALAADAEALKR